LQVLGEAIEARGRAFPHPRLERRVASKTRVMTISRSDAVLNVVAPSLFAVAMILLLLFQVL
jgi:hypothetical protein